MPAPRFFHYAGIFILFAWSGVLLYFYASGRVDFLLKGNFQYGPLFGGLGLAVMGLFNVFTAKAKVDCGHDHGGHEHNHDHSECGHDHHEHTHECDHDHSEHEHACDHPLHEHDHDHDHVGHSHDDQTVPSIIATMIIVLVPTLAAAGMAQNKFSVDALANKGLYSNEVNAQPTVTGNTSAGSDGDRYTLADLEKQVRKSDEGNFLIPVPSLFYSAADEELADVLKGQPVETTGQVAPEIAENDPDGTRLRFYRLFVSCCLADARPIGFSAEFGKAPPEFAQDSWVKIVGEMIYPEQDGRKVPVLKVNEIEAIPEPKDMMY